MIGFLPSRPAQIHRAARNLARWLTEVGRFHHIFFRIPSIFESSGGEEPLSPRVDAPRGSPLTFISRQPKMSGDDGLFAGSGANRLALLKRA